MQNCTDKQDVFFLSCNFRNFLLISGLNETLSTSDGIIFIHLISKKLTPVMGYNSVPWGF